MDIDMHLLQNILAAIIMIVFGWCMSRLFRTKKAKAIAEAHKVEDSILDE